MVKRLPILLLIFSAPLAMAQLDSNSITVTATRSMAQQPDQVVIAVTVQSGLSTSLDDVVAALQGSGITAANFAGVSTTAFQAVTNLFPTPASNPTLNWTFVLSAPLSKIKDTLATLNALQKSLAQQNKGLTLSFNVQGTQVSAQQQQSQVCPTADLLGDAQAQAQKLAGAAGLSVGAVLAMASGTTVPSAAVPVVSPVGAALSFVSSITTVPSICSMTVKFAVLRY